MAHASEHAQFVQSLAISCEVLSCVHLLCDFQVLACIPAHEEIACEDVADIVGLREGLLRAVIGMTASVGFLSIPRPGVVSHSSLSAQFASDVGVLDAFAFLAETLSPYAVRMPKASRRESQPSQHGLEAFGDHSNYVVDLQRHTRLQRQAVAHSRLAMGNDHDVGEQRSRLLACLDWASLGGTTVVHVDAPSTTLAVALATENAAVSIVVEGVPPSESVPPEFAARIRLQVRPPFKQPVQDASVYIVHLASPSITQRERSNLLDGLACQLAVHLPILRQHPLARVVLLVRVLPETITCTEATFNGRHSASSPETSPQCLALYRNLALHQLTGRGDHERADVLACVRCTSDAHSVLIVTNEVRGSEIASLTAFEIQYLATDLDHSACFSVPADPSRKIV